MSIFKRKEKRPYSKDCKRLIETLATEAMFELQAIVDSLDESTKKKLREFLQKRVADAAQIGYEDHPDDTRSEMEKMFGSMNPGCFYSCTITPAGEVKEEAKAEAKAQ
jgi:hypothetical protein